MPGTIKIRVVEARDLPVMDRSSELTDAYVEIRFADTPPQRTEICRKTLNPVWNQVFRIEVHDDCNVQDHPVQLRVWDYDIVSADDVIGMVIVDLNGLIDPDGPAQIQGWFPIFDTIRGLRGELLVSVKVDFFGDVNPYKESSAGIRLYSASRIPVGLQLEEIRGFVEELVVTQDPEYAWADTFRTARTSNEARRLLLYKLSGQLRRQIGWKVLELGCNAVLGYQQGFDLEGEGGIVARCYGTACKLRKDGELFSSPTSAPAALLAGAAGAHTDAVLPSPTDESNSANPTPTGDPRWQNLAPSRPSRSIEEPTALRNRIKAMQMNDVALMTLCHFPSSVSMRIGGVVAARAVKLLKGTSEQIVHDQWWTELREEIRAHARSLGCRQVVGYSETTAIEKNDLIVLSCSGTAVNVDIRSIVAEKQDAKSSRSRRRRRRRRVSMQTLPCSLCHVPYSTQSPPLRMQLQSCLSCGKRCVPEVLLATIEIPDGLQTVGTGELIEARVCRSKRKAQGEANATSVNEAIPFLEYDVHRQLMYKMKVHGHNAAFNLRIQVTVGETLIIGVATATGVNLPCLPVAPMLHLTRTVDGTDSTLASLEEQIMHIADLHRAKQREQELDRKLWTRSMTPEAEAGHEEEELVQFGTPSSHGEGEWKATSVERRFGTRRGESHHELIVGLPRGGEGVSETAEASETSIEIPSVSVDVPERSVLEQPKPGRVVSPSQPSTKDDAGESSSSEGESESSSGSDFDENLEQSDLQKATVVVEVDDETDEEIMSLLIEPSPPEGVALLNTETIPGICSDRLSTLQLLTAISRTRWSTMPRRLNQHLAKAFHDLYRHVTFKLMALAPCYVLSVQTVVRALEEETIEIALTGIAMLECTRSTLLEEERNTASISDVHEPSVEPTQPTTTTVTALPRGVTQNEWDLGARVWEGGVFPVEAEFGQGTPRSAAKSSLPPDLQISHPIQRRIEISPLSYVPGGKAVRYLGRFNLHVIKESWSVKEEGGLGAISYRFLMEALAMTRAHIAAMSGNTLLGFQLGDHRIMHNEGKNQAYVMLTISGDVADVRCWEDSVPRAGMNRLLTLSTNEEGHLRSQDHPMRT